MQTANVPTYWVEIHMAGDFEQARQACREFCHKVGLCVTVQAQTFIYVGGEEAGFVVGLINYPRFPSEPEQLRTKASDLAEVLLGRLCQHSYLLLAPDTTLWVSRREENSAAK